MLGWRHENVWYTAEEVDEALSKRAEYLMAQRELQAVTVDLRAEVKLLVKNLKELSRDRVVTLDDGSRHWVRPGIMLMVGEGKRVVSVGMADRQETL